MPLGSTILSTCCVWTALQPASTKGWLGLSVYAADLYSSAARPRDASAFTHKLDLGLSANIGLFNNAEAHEMMRL